MCSNRTTTILAGYDHGIEVLAYDYVEAFAETSRLSPSERPRDLYDAPNLCRNAGRVDRVLFRSSGLPL